MSNYQNATTALMDITKRPEIIFSVGRGSWLEDQSGERYLDFVQGWAVNCLGHSPDVLVRALSEQAAKLINCSPAFLNEPMLRLAKDLAEVSGLERVFFTNSGGEANEGAIKLARKWGALHMAGAYEIVTLDGGFHGRTLATMSASGKPGWDVIFEPKVPGFVKVPINDIDALSAAVGERTVAVMLEPIQGEAGVFPISHEFLQAARALTEARGALLILDEIQTGMGRTGEMFAFQGLGVRPDIMTLGKGMGGGAPLAALLASEAVSCFAHGDQGGTFNGNPLMMAAGQAVLDTLRWPGFLETVRARSGHLQVGLEALSNRHGLGTTRGEGLLLALDVGQPRASEIVAAALDRNLLLNAPRPDSLRFMPALTVSEDEIDLMLDRLDQACLAAL